MSTIAAISTGRAPGGIGVIRISGENAISVADKVFSSFNGKKLEEIPGYSALYGKALDEKGSILLAIGKPYSFCAAFKFFSKDIDHLFRKASSSLICLIVENSNVLKSYFCKSCLSAFEIRL